MWSFFKSTLPLLYNVCLLGIGVALLRAIFREPRLGVCIRSSVVVLLAALGMAGAAACISFFGAMRLLSYGLFGHVPLVLLGSAVALARRARRAALGFAVAGVSIQLIGLYAFLVEPQWLEVTRVRLSAPGLSRPLKVVLVSDLQTDQIGDYERDVFHRIQAEHADLVLLTGDYLQTPGWTPAERALLEEQFRAAVLEAGLQSSLGIFAVQGDTERSQWPRLFGGTGITPLPRTRTLQFGELCITGLARTDSFDRGLELLHCGLYHIVFGHSPDFALGDVDADLLLAGHTHGGQVRLPFVGPLVTFSWVPRHWAAGVTKLAGGRTLVVSRGIGMERGQAPRLRFLCRPQLVVLELEPAGRRE